MRIVALWAATLSDLSPESSGKDALYTAAPWRVCQPYLKVSACKQRAQNICPGITKGRTGYFLQTKDISTLALLAVTAPPARLPSQGLSPPPSAS